MTLYVIEKKIRREWHPLAFFCFTEKSILGTEHTTIACAGQSHEKIKQSFEIAKSRFPENKLRVKEYERV